MHFPGQLGELEAKILQQVVFLDEDSSTFTYFHFTDRLNNQFGQAGAMNSSRPQGAMFFSNSENIDTSNMMPQTKTPSLLQKITSPRGNLASKVPVEFNPLEISPELFEKNGESRTTVMMRNIPNRYDLKSLLDLIEPEFKGLFDFVYVPIDFKNKCNMGYAFINFTETRHLARFYRIFQRKTWSHVHSQKVCCVCFARIQGRNNLIAHFKRTNYLKLNLEHNMLPYIVPNPSEDFFIF